MPIEFHSFRSEGIGGSDASSVLGINRYRSALDVYNEKLNGCLGGEQNCVFLRGQKLEHLVRALYEKETGRKVSRCGDQIVDPEHPCLRGNIDGFDDEASAVVEFKTSSSKDESIKPEWLIQVRHYMSILGCEKAFIAVLRGSYSFLEGLSFANEWDMDRPYYFSVVEVRQKGWEEVRPQLVSWWFDHVVARVPPPDRVFVPDQSIDYYSAEILAEEYRRIKATEKASKDRMEEILNILGALPHEQTKHVFRTQNLKRNTFDTERFKADYPVLFGEYSRESEVTRRTVSK